MKKEYKELRKKLKNEFKPSKKNLEHKLKGSVGLWLIQCDIEPTSIHLNIICSIFGSVPYCNQEYDRKYILDYLQNNKYKEFKSDLQKTSKKSST